MDFQTEQMSCMKGKPLEYKSSKNVRRGFCEVCGSSLSFRNLGHPEYITMTIASLDDPNLVKPTYHIYATSQLKWLQIADDCNRFPAGPEKSSN